MKYLLSILSVLFIMSCGSETPKDTAPEKAPSWVFMEELRQILATKAENQNGVFNFLSEQALCDILDAHKIEEIFDIPADRVSYHRRDYIFKSPISASCAAIFLDNENIESKIILEMYCNPKVNPGNHVGDNFISQQMNIDLSEFFQGDDYKYREVSGVGDRAVLNPGLGKLIWYVDNYVIYTLQYNTGLQDNLRHLEELKIMAEYITSRTLETLH